MEVLEPLPGCGCRDSNKKRVVLAAPSSMPFLIILRLYRSAHRALATAAAARKAKKDLDSQKSLLYRLEKD
jgi:hypothetical protein